jgi:Rrf2 family protein
MLGKTSISAIRSLLFLAGQDLREPWSPRRLAEEIGESPSYLAKVLRHLVKAGLLDSEKGVKGGVRLVRPAATIRLLDIVEACQGTVVGDYCKATGLPARPCAFHQAAVELHQAITGVLGKWTLEDLLAGPFSPKGATCLMSGVPQPLVPLRYDSSKSFA